MQTNTWMGAFEADTPKPSKIYSTMPSSSSLARPKPQIEDRHETAEIVYKLSNDGNIIKQVNGIPDKLKETQTYTQPFARAVFDGWCRDGDMTFADDDDESVESDDGAEVDEWEDAQLSSLLNTVKIPADRKIF